MPKYGYVPNMIKSHVRSLSATHFWLLILLVGLFWFNEPFIGARVYEKVFFLFFFKIYKTLISSNTHVHSLIIHLFFFFLFFSFFFSQKSVDNELTKFATFTSTVFICILLYYWLVLLDDCRLRSKVSGSLKRGSEIDVVVPCILCI
jgi:hypothetical protein